MTQVFDEHNVNGDAVSEGALSEEVGFDSEYGGMGARQRSSSAPPDLERGNSPSGGAKKKNISVIARFRPENALEVANGGINTVEFGADQKTCTMVLNDRATEKTQFHFNKVFQSYSTQLELYSYVGEPVLEAFFAGVNCSILAYGQTGTGKTYTMMGEVNEKGFVVREQGIIPRLFAGIFRMISEKEDQFEFDVSLTFVELYMEQINDLLREKNTKMVGGRPQTVGQEGKLEIRASPDGTIFVTNCSTWQISSMSDAMSIVQTGLNRRSTFATTQNKLSSRSHAILLCTMMSKHRETKTIRSSQLYMVDLAGSEKVSKTETYGLRLEEAKMINTSLFSLGQVITALTEATRHRKHMHIPYRDSKLTRLLENSLGGNAMTFMIVTCSPNSWNDQETLSSLRFGAKAQMIKTLPQTNMRRTVEELEMLLDKSKNEIEMQRSTINLLKNQIKNLSHMPEGSHAVGSPRLAGGVGAQMMGNMLHAKLQRIVQSVAVCPLTSSYMKDPVVMMDGYTYERRAINNYLMNENNNLASPVTGQKLNAGLMIPNFALKGLFEMCLDEGFNIAESNFSAAPQTPWDVYDLCGVIMDFFPLKEMLLYARINSNFARTVYNRDRWEDGIAERLEGASLKLQQHVRTLSLPAHKVFVILESGENVEEKLTRSQFTSKTVALFSSGLHRGVPKIK